MFSFSSGRNYVVRPISLQLIIIGILTFLSSTAFAISVDVADSPTNSQDLTVQTIGSARKSILLNIYEIDSSEVVNALIERVKAGVQLEVIFEGEPVGGVNAPARKLQNALIQEMKNAGTQNHFYEMTTRAGGSRRFHFDHAKYAVIDGQSVMIGSENYSVGGQPSGVVGNRGWEVVIHDKDAAKYFREIFEADSNTKEGDLIDWTKRKDSMTEKEESSGKRYREEPTSEPKRKRKPLHLNADKVSYILSPDNSRSDLVSLLKSAKSSLDLELMTFAPNWGGVGQKSPLLNEVLAAAKRGVKVRVLLNDERAFSHFDNGKKTKNNETITLLNEKAAAGNLDLTARLANVKSMRVTYIHNKGVLIDGNQTLVSSINWNENSVERNREAAVVITSEEVNAYYQKLFNKDWKASEQAPQWPSFETHMNGFTMNPPFPELRFNGIGDGCNHEF